MRSRWSRFIAWLLATPPARGFDQNPRLLAGLLATLLAALIGIMAVLFNLPLPPGKLPTYLVLFPAVWFGLALAFGVNRRGHYRLAAWLLVGVANLLVAGFFWFDPSVPQGDFLPLFYTLFPIIIAGVFLSGWAVLAVAAVQVGLIVLAMTQWLDTTLGIRLLIFLGMHGVLAVAANLINRRNREQIDRQNQQLRASEERLSLVLEGSHDGFWDFDLTTQQAYSSPRAVTMLGYDPAEVHDQGVNLWMMLVHPDDKPPMLRAFEAHLAGHTPLFHSEVRVRHKKGHWVWVELRGKVVARAPDGRPLRAAGTQSDISARKNAEQTLAEEHIRLRAILTASRDGLVLVGHRGMIHIVNQPALNLLGLPGAPADWEGRLIYRVLQHLSNPIMVHDTLSEMGRIRTGPEPPGQGEWELPNRHVAWFNLPVLEGDRWLGRLLVLRDVTQERQAAQLSHDLTHAMVHDLRSPLASLLATFDLLAYGNPSAFSAEQHAMLSLARTQANTMLTLVNSILELHQLESGHIELDVCPVRPMDLMLEGVYAQSALALTRQLTVETRVPADLPPVWGDPNLLRRVIQNLINNALKFTPAGGHITITAQAAPAEAPTAVLFQVHNTGPGIPPDLQGQLFRKFSAGRVPGRGSGLGLAFCRLVIEAHQGRIGVDSAPETGTTFFFTVPLAPEAGAAE